MVSVLLFKSRRYNEKGTHSGMMLGLARAPHYLRPYHVVGDEPLFGHEKFGEVEDPFVWQSRHGGYEMIAEDMSGRAKRLNARPGDRACRRTEPHGWVHP